MNDFKNTSPAETFVGHGQQIWMIDEADLFLMVECKGKECFGEKFSLWKEDYPVLRKLLVYFFADHELAIKENLDLKKGHYAIRSSRLRQDEHHVVGAVFSK
jgi:hypothetical protein